MEHTEVGIHQLKTHLSAYLRKVEDGETMTITRRGTPVARITPVVEKDERSLKDKMKTLEEAGIISWNGKKPPSREPVAEVKGRRSVAELLLEDRR